LERGKDFAGVIAKVVSPNFASKASEYFSADVKPGSISVPFREDLQKFAVINDRLSNLK